MTNSKAIFNEIIATGFIATMELIRNLNPDMKMKPKDELSAEIKKVMGDPFPSQLLEFKRLIKEQFDRSKITAHLNLTKSTILSELSEAQKKLSAVQLDYDNFIESQEESTWNAFKRISESEANPDQVTNWLYQLITERKVSRDWQTMAEKLALICDLDPEKYKLWQREICEMFINAYCMRTAYNFYLIFPTERYKGADSSNAVSISTVEKQLRNINRRTRKVFEVMQHTYHQLLANFLLKKCGDLEHKHCGSKDEKCCELASKVYLVLRDETSRSTEQVAKKILDDLITSYPQFKWSVVVTEDERLPELHLNLEHRANIWMQRFGSKSPPGLVKSFINESLRESDSISEGFGSYGCLLCYRMRPNTQKSALIFWADSKAILTPKMIQERGRLQDRWENDKNFQALAGHTGAGGVYRAIGKMLDRDMDFLFGVGLRQTTKYPKIAFQLFKDVHGEFPVRLGDKNSIILVWPEVKSPIATQSESLLIQGYQSVLSQGGGNRFKVFKGRRQREGNLQPLEEFVAVKEIPLTIGEDNYKKEKRSGEIADLAHRLGKLIKLNHPNVIRHLGFQAFLPTTAVEVPTYRMVMEYCSGGSLVEKVQQSVTLKQVVEWSKYILEGLAYLHDQGIVHKAIRGDHIMFTGPENGGGILKIISIERSAILLSHFMRSFVNEAEYLFFQAPDITTHIGSKSDIWSFGCVVIQMMQNGDPPIFPDASKQPKIPKGLPNLLNEIIQRCLSLQYDGRPSAKYILDTGLFSQQDKELTFTRSTHVAPIQEIQNS